MLLKKEKKTGHGSAVTKDKAAKTHKKGASAATNESNMAAELKNREHGNEKPAR